VDLMTKFHKPGTEMRVQVLHSYNHAAADSLRDLISPVFKCTMMPIHYMSPALAAHTGATMVGVAFAPMEVFKDIP